MNNNQSQKIEPYRSFFLTSLFGGILGVSLWILVWMIQMKWIPETVLTNHYPVNHHIDIIIGLFILPIIKGFVLTAVPIFTGTKSTSNAQMYYFLFLQALLFVLSFIGTQYIYYFVLSLDVVSLSFFVYNKFNDSIKAVSIYLNSLFIGIIFLSIGAISILIHSLVSNIALLQIGKYSIFYYAFPLMILGVGSKLIVAITTHENPQLRMEWINKAEKMSKKELYSFMGIYIGLFLIESILLFLEFQSNNLFLSTIRLLRPIVLFYWFYQYFHILSFREYKGKLQRMLYISLWMFLLGMIGMALPTKQSISFAHLYFISGLSMLIFGVMSRVVLSHENQDITHEKVSNVYYWIGGFFVTAALTRALILFVPDRMYSHYAYSAICFIIGILIWFYHIGRYMIAK